MTSPPLACPSCESTQVRTTYERETFRYGKGNDAKEIVVEVPVRTCGHCGFQFTDQVAEAIRHEAVCHELGVMTPQEIIKLRQTYGMSRAEFARLTRIGEASLGRWESGQLIQNAAYDQLLYLLSFADNLERIKCRTSGGPLPPIPSCESESRRRELLPLARLLTHKRAASKPSSELPQ